MNGKLATVTSIQPTGRFGALDIDSDNQVHGFKEKPKGDGAWINGGFFVMEPQVLDYIAGDSTMLEKEPLEGLARAGQLISYKHAGFWQPMGTPCGIKITWKISGQPAQHPGRHGNKFLERKEGFSHRPHRVQRELAQSMAVESRCSGNRLRTCPTDHAQPF
jgi:hypothetical protein